MPAYNPYYPGNYQPVGPYQAPYYPNQTVQPVMGQSMATQQPVPPQPMQTAPVQPVQPQIQSGGFVPVRSVDEARNWPIAPGNSVTFIDENAGYVYTKTSYNQFDRPTFSVYKLVKEEDPAQTTSNGPVAAGNGQAAKDIPYAMKEDMAALAGVVRGLNETVGAVQEDIKTMKGDMYGVVGQKKTVAKKEAPKKEVEEDA